MATTEEKSIFPFTTTVSEVTFRIWSPKKMLASHNNWRHPLILYPMFIVHIILYIVHVFQLQIIFYRLTNIIQNIVGSICEQAKWIFFRSMKNGSRMKYRFRLHGEQWTVNICKNVCSFFFVCSKQLGISCSKVGNLQFKQMMTLNERFNK